MRKTTPPCQFVFSFCARCYARYNDVLINAMFVSEGLYSCDSDNDSVDLPRPWITAYYYAISQHRTPRASAAWEHATLGKAEPQKKTDRPKNDIENEVKNKVRKPGDKQGEKRVWEMEWNGMKNGVKMGWKMGWKQGEKLNEKRGEKSGEKVWTRPRNNEVKNGVKNSGENFLVTKLHLHDQKFSPLFLATFIAPHLRVSRKPIARHTPWGHAVFIRHFPFKKASSVQACECLAGGVQKDHQAQKQKPDLLVAPHILRGAHVGRTIQCRHSVPNAWHTCTPYGAPTADIIAWPLRHQEWS